MPPLNRWLAGHTPPFREKVVDRYVDDPGVKAVQKAFDCVQARRGVWSAVNVWGNCPHGNNIKQSPSQVTDKQTVYNAEIINPDKRNREC